MGAGTLGLACGQLGSLSSSPQWPSAAKNNGPGTRDASSDLPCAPGCGAGNVGDGWCDTACAVAACGMDEGDCDGCAPGVTGRCSTAAQQRQRCRESALKQWTPDQLQGIGCTEEAATGGGDVVPLTAAQYEHRALGGADVLLTLPCAA